MKQIIIHKNENGGVTLIIPTPEALESHGIEWIQTKDAPTDSIIIDDSELPKDTEFFNAWELVDGKVVVNEAKKQAIIDAIQAPITAKASALAKLAKLGLTEEEVKAIIG
jgi:hypothetical protein